MVEFILGMDWWLRALIYAAALIILAAHYFGEYSPAIWKAIGVGLCILLATEIAPDGSKWALLGDFYALFWLHKFLLPKWYALYFIGLTCFIIAI